MKRILIIKLGALGDIMLSMDAFHAIRAKHPGADITLLTRKQFVPLAKKMPWFDSVIADPNPSGLEIKKWLEVRRTLREGSYQRVYDLQINDRTGIYFHLLGRMKAEWCGSARGCSHQRHNHRRDPVPAAERLLRFLESVDVPRAGSADTSWLTGEVRDLELPQRFVMLVPGCSPQHPHKRWPASHYAELALLFEKTGIATLAVGTDVDLPAIQAVQAEAPSLISLVGKTDIGQLAEVARRSLGVVGNDTGPIHIAAIAGAPTLVLMSGKSDPVRMKPHGPDVGCLQGETLSALTPQEVLQSARLRSK